MWEIRKLFVARISGGGDAMYIGESKERALSYCPTGVEGNGVIEEWICAVNAGFTKTEVWPLARCEAEDRINLDGAVIDVKMPPQR